MEASSTYTPISELYQLFQSSSGVCTDTRKITEGCLYFGLKGANFDGNQFAEQAIAQGALAAVVDDKDVARQQSCFLVADVLDTLQKLAVFHRDQLTIPVIGITGSNGKTTTKELVYQVFQTSFRTAVTQGNFNNHIGVPLTVLAIQETAELAIVEMGANHIGEIASLCEICKPTHGLITNIGKAHLEGFGSLEGVARGKSELYAYLKEHDGVVFVNGADEHLMRMSKRLENPIYYTGDQSTLGLSLSNARALMTVDWEGQAINTQLVGDYNFANVAAAVALGVYFKIGRDRIIKSIEDYVPKNNRSEIIRKGTVSIILDAYNANPSSMEAAIHNFEQLEADGKIAVLGDMYELGTVAAEEHQRIADLASSAHFDEVYLCGKHFYEVNVQSASVKKIADRESLEQELMNQDFERKHLLIKGSRGMGLEKLLDVILPD